MKIKPIILIFFFYISCFASCSSPSVSNSIGIIPKNFIVALAPSGGVLAEAIGIELFNRGYQVFDTKEFSNMMIRYNMTEIELAKPDNLNKLRDMGINAILTVKSVTGYDGKPQSASVRINSTNNWKVIAGVSWNNGWGGRAGSIADRTMRVDISGAASQIVNQLVER